MQVRRRKKGARPEGRRRGREEESDGGRTAGPILPSLGSWTILLAVSACLLHSMYLANLFENDRFFSHLSPLERELSFRTEMGLYYNYYKVLVEAPSVSAGLSLVLHDNLTEYPTTINTLQRFNLYPELSLSLLFRGYRWMLGLAGSSGVKCFSVSRGYGQSEVKACNGLGDASYFYVHCIFFLNGAVAGALVILGAILSGSVWGGVFSVVGFLYNHGHSTRVMWTPPLRESFAMPFLLLHLISLTLALRCRGFSWRHMLSLVVTSLSFLLPWQFSQFVLLTEVLAVLCVHCLRLIPTSTLLLITSSLSVAFAANVLLQFANALLLISFLPASLIATSLVAMGSKVIDRLKYIPLIAVVEVVLVLCGTVAIKMALTFLLGFKEDEHIGHILLSKFSSFRNFHTQLYTCANEFNFLPLSYVWDTSLTLLLPMGMCAVVMVMWGVVRAIRERGGKVDCPLTSSSNDVALQVYHVVQALAFVVMATLIMRLKLLLTPQLAVLTSLLPTVQLFPKRRRKLLLGALLLLCSLKGWHNIHSQWSVIGEYNNADGEQLVHWVRDHTPQTAVFAGTMPTMATILLTTQRPIVNHPHYENAGLRNRTKLVYGLFSRKSPSTVHAILRGLGVDYVISEDGWCGRRSGPGCSFPEIWDEEDPANQGNPVFCETLQDHTPHPFTPAFTNTVYRVLRVT